MKTIWHTVNVAGQMDQLLKNAFKITAVFPAISCRSVLLMRSMLPLWPNRRSVLKRKLATARTCY